MEHGEALKRFNQQKRKLKRLLGKMKSALPEALDRAFDRYFDREDLTFLKMEEKILRMESLISRLEVEVDRSGSPAILRQVAGRANYIADRLDELESVLYKRSRRRSRFPFNLSDFFKHTTQQDKNGSFSSWKEISSLSEAYRTLDLEEGCDMAEVTTSFRRFAKKCHPDARGGDRSEEKQLRRVVEAYQMIKESLFE
ncbi:MAG: J domain-containing protein [Nitrospiria bacterium]